ncbi:leucine-rich repeat-containing G-protein coupled receptor 4-like [Ptychodera flava]|uniref:leucine-rich repeat-containing G-protein coupled receptor 4-like n=1 Tax=Ptychodera flava TaxID=63121 RepID=UPI00396A2007
MAWKLHETVNVLAILLLMITKCNCQQHNFKYCQSMTSARDGPRFDCSSLQLTEVPSYLPDSVTELNFDTNYLEDLDEDSFKHLPTLKKLVLSKNDISALFKKNFQGLGNLKVLDLSENEIRSIECETFSALSSLEVLNLSRNVQKPPPDIRYCYKWEILDGRYRWLPNVYLTQKARLSLSKCMWIGLSKLQILLLQRVKIDHRSLLPGTFSSLQDLQLLDLSWNRLTHLKAGVFSGLNKLETLILYYCNVKMIENGTFSGLHSLKYLNLMFSNLTEFSNPLHLPRKSPGILHLGGPLEDVFLDLDYITLTSLKLSPDTVPYRSKKFNIKLSERTIQRKVSLDKFSQQPLVLPRVAEVTLKEANVLPYKIVAPKLKKLDLSYSDLRLNAGENYFVLRVDAAVEELNLSGNTYESGIKKPGKLLANLEDLQAKKARELTILDVGVGGCGDLIYHPYGARVIGVLENGEDLKKVQNNSVDTVVSTLVMCKVRDPADYVREVKRVLKPVSIKTFIRHQ